MHLPMRLQMLREVQQHQEIIKMFKIVILESESVGKDMDWTAFEKMGDTVIYGATTNEQMPERIKDADIVIANKVEFNQQTIGQAEKLKLVCLTATGTDNLDKTYLETRGIQWRNVAGYSTEPVAQHTFALLFYLIEKLPYYDEFVKEGTYATTKMFTHYGRLIYELYGKTWGIIGLGTIGKKVALLAKTFGCRVIYYSTSGKNTKTEYECVSFDELLAQSDVISVHAPLNDVTRGMMNKEAFHKMKSTAVFINVARGPIVVEKDLAEALDAGEIGAAGLDVLSKEPIERDNPLLQIKNKDKLIITPHIAWASVEARTRLMHLVERNVAEYIAEQTNK